MIFFGIFALFYFGRHLALSMTPLRFGLVKNETTPYSRVIPITGARFVIRFKTDKPIQTCFHSFSIEHYLLTLGSQSKTNFFCQMGSVRIHMSFQISEVIIMNRF